MEQPTLCANEECLIICTEKHPLGAGRHTFTAASPWQRFCSTQCRNRQNYIDRTIPRRQAKEDVETIK